MRTAPSIQKGLAQRGRRTLGVLLFIFGILSTGSLGALAVWGDFEASLFDVAIHAESGLDALSCPVFITRHEVGEISASFRNTGVRPVDRPIRARMTEGFVTLIREENVRLPLQPGETQSHTWTVTAEDAAYGGLLILARVSALRQSPMPSQSGSCGIIVLNVPWLTGGLLTFGWLSGGLLTLLGGGWIWQRSAAPSTSKQRPATVAAAAIAAVVLAILVCGLSGLWLPGIMLLALLVLMVVATGAYLLQGN